MKGPRGCQSLMSLRASLRGNLVRFLGEVKGTKFGDPPVKPPLWSGCLCWVKLMCRIIRPDPNVRYGTKNPETGLSGSVLYWSSPGTLGTAGSLRTDLVLPRLMLRPIFVSYVGKQWAEIRTQLLVPYRCLF